jgi:hypothetical protein
MVAFAPLCSALDRSYNFLMRKLLLLLGLLPIGFFSPGNVEAAFDFGFKTPSGAAYCQLQVENASATGFLCFTPNDGFWIRFGGISGANPTVSKGYSDRYRSFHPTGARVLGFGGVWHSSDASAVVCRSRETGLTCKATGGLSFWLGRYKGYRIFYAPPGERPMVKPLFRTTQGVWCGIDLNNLEQAIPMLTCWHSATGLELNLSHGYRTLTHRREITKGYRPNNFNLLKAGNSFSWRCRTLDRGFAENCSAAAGTQVFTCTSAARLTCRNLDGRGFWVDRHGGFETF